jgi:hypothetical protein
MDFIPESKIAPVQELAAAAYLLCSGCGPAAYCWWNGRLYMLRGNAGYNPPLARAMAKMHCLPGHRAALWPYSSYAAIMRGGMPEGAALMLLEVFGGLEEFVFLNKAYMRNAGGFE